MKSSKFIFLLSLVVFFSQCKKGSDDPLFSLRTRKGRMTGNWTMTEGYKISTNYAGEETKITYKNQSYEIIYWGRFVDSGPVKFTMSLQKDGSMHIERNLEPYSSEGR